MSVRLLMDITSADVAVSRPLHSSLLLSFLSPRVCMSLVLLLLPACVPVMCNECVYVSERVSARESASVKSPANDRPA